MFGLLAKRWAPLFLLAFAASGCATYSGQTAAMRSNYRGGEFKEALTSLEALKLQKEGKGSLLYKMERSMIEDRLNNHRDARALLIDADKVTDDLITRSATKSAATLVVNDTVSDYEPEDYEKVAIQTQLALSFLQTGELQSARVAARKINSRLDEINKQYRDEKPGRYSKDAFALYLSGLIYEAKGEWDDAIIDYRSAYKLYRDSYSWFVADVPSQLISSYYGALLHRGRTKDATELKKENPKVLDGYSSRKGDGDLIAIFEIGTIANKENAEHVLPVGGQVIRFSFPRIPYTSDHVGKTGVEIAPANGKEKYFKAEHAQNLNKIAYYNLEERRTRTAIKATGRLIAKGVAVHAVHQKYGTFAGLLANVLSAATETGDTRGWNLLPAQLYILRLPLAPGMYDASFYKDGSDLEKQKIEIKSERMTFVRIK